jgi:hypothetical protein
MDDYTGALSWKFKGPARYSDPKDYGTYNSLLDRGSFKVAIPCRHCIGCHLDYARSWSNRMMLEFDQVKKGFFLTLTYNNEHLPKTDSGVPTLSKRDWQLFMKRLRKHFEPVRIRFFAAGEYGSRTHRPHMHAIIFGLDLSDLPDLRVIGHNEIGNHYYSSTIIEKIWGNGFVLLGEVNSHTCNYVARYVIKKHYKKSLPELNGAIQEFTLSSRRPGIGLGLAEQYLSRMYRDSDYITLLSGDEVHTFPIPKAMLKKCKKLDFFLDRVNEIQYNRFNDSNERLRSDLDFLGVSFDDYLSIQHRAFKESIKVLPERKDFIEKKESKP